MRHAVARVLALCLLLAPALAVAQTVTLSPQAIEHFVDNNGNACVGCSLYTYAAGTITLQATYTDSTGATQQTNPIVLNSRGEPENTMGNSIGIWLTPTLGYKFVLAPAGDTNPPTNPFWTIDQVYSGITSNGPTINNATLNTPTIIGGTISGSALTSSTLLDNASAFVATVNFPGAISSADIVTVLGSAGTPDQTDNPIVVFQKWGGSPSPAADLNPTVYASAYKTSPAASQHVEAIFAEAQDNAGWSGSGSNNFIEGMRAQGTLNTGTALGSAYGLVAAAGTATGTSFTYLIGIESNTVNQYGNASPTFNPNSFVAAFLATNGFGNTSYTSDVAFAVNQFSTNPYIRGFYVPEASGAAVSGAAFETEETSEWGLKMSVAPITYGAIGLPNDVPIRGQIHGDTGDAQTYNLMYLAADNYLVLGFDPPAIHLGPDAPGTVTLPGTALVEVGLPAVGTLTPAGTVCISTTGVLYYKSGGC